MRKIRSDALWHKLTPEQQAKINHWFFVENLSFRAVHERIGKELGIRCALSIIGPMYHHCNKLRSHERETILQGLTNVITEPGINLNMVRNDSMNVVASRLLRRSMENDGPSTEIAKLGKVVLEGQGRDIQQQRLDLLAKQVDLKRMESQLKAKPKQKP